MAYVGGIAAFTTQQFSDLINIGNTGQQTFNRAITPVDLSKTILRWLKSTNYYPYQPGSGAAGGGPDNGVTWLSSSSQISSKLHSAVAFTGARLACLLDTNDKYSVQRGVEPVSVAAGGFTTKDIAVNPVGVIANCEVICGAGGAYIRDLAGNPICWGVFGVMVAADTMRLYCGSTGTAGNIDVPWQLVERM